MMSARTSYPDSSTSSPTGDVLLVQAQDERSQVMNRALALERAFSTIVQGLRRPKQRRPPVPAKAPRSDVSRRNGWPPARSATGRPSTKSRRGHRRLAIPILYHAKSRDRIVGATMSRFERQMGKGSTRDSKCELLPPPRAAAFLSSQSMTRSASSRVDIERLYRRPSGRSSRAIFFTVSRLSISYICRPLPAAWHFLSTSIHSCM